MSTRALSPAADRRPRGGGDETATRPGGARRLLRHAIATLAAGLALVLAGCGEPPRPPLSVGLNPWVGYDPLVLAREQGLADATRVKLVELSTHAESFRHFRNGVLDAMAVTLDQALELAEEGVDLRIVAVLDESAGADAVVGLPSMDSSAALRGRPVALEASVLNRLVLQRWLATAGLGEPDVTLVPLEASQHLAALQAGQVVAAVSYEPLAEQIRAAGFVTLFDTRQMPGEIVDVLVVRGEALAQRPQDVDALLRAWNAGLAAFQADPVAAAAVLAPGTGLSEAQYRQVQAGLRHVGPQESLARLTGQPAPLALSGERLYGTLRAAQLLRRPVDWVALLEPGPATRVQAGVAP
jgi:NitT/TauT family transport system substrate-binding protein